MTVLEEISTSPRANWEFWTDRARLNLACYRENRNMSPAIWRLDRAGFRSCMRNRRERTYLEREGWDD